MVIRKAAVAGKFYEDKPEALIKELSILMKPLPYEERKQIMGGVSPHAGYIYSGHVAGELYSRIYIPQKIIILSPNHTGYGARISLFPDGYWETPLGNVKVDGELCSLIQSKYKPVARDKNAHLFEHSLEVQLPFMQYLKSDFQLVPITLMHLSMKECVDLAKAISGSIKELGEDVLVIASSDLNHYEDQRVTEKKDMLAIEKVVSLDPVGLLEATARYGISMCGVIPATVMLIICNELGAWKADLLSHATSGDVNGDYNKVVGYGAMWVY